MIIGGCPYCENTNMTPIGPVGAWSKETCDNCKKEYWLKHSRLEPIAYPLDQIKVNEETKMVELIDKSRTT